MSSDHDQYDGQHHGRYGGNNVQQAPAEAPEVYWPQGAHADAVGPYRSGGGRSRLPWLVAALAVAAVVGVGAVLVVGAGEDPAPAPVPVATVSPADQQAAQEQAWINTQTYYARYDQAAQAASMDGVDLEAVAWPAEEAGVAASARGHSEGSRHQVGTVVVTLLSSSFAPSDYPDTVADVAYGRVTLQVCLDGDGYDLVDDATGQSVQVPAPGQSEIKDRVPATVTVERSGGVWKVRTQSTDFAGTC